MNRERQKELRVKKSIRGQLCARKRRIQRRMDKLNLPADLGRPMFCPANVQYEVSGRSVGTAYGGKGLIHRLVQELGLAEAIDRRLKLFKLYLP